VNVENNFLKYLKEDIYPYRRAMGGGLVGVILFHRGFHLLISHRLQCLLLKIPIIGKLFAKMLWYLTCIQTGSEVSYHAKIGSGAYFPHPIGIVIGDAIIEKKVTILQGVTIGKKERDGSSFVFIGEGVFIGAGAKIIGDLKIGRNSLVGANSVVLKDVPENSIALGIPAKISSKSSIV
jgi:serine O-acetyltransferase